MGTDTQQIGIVGSTIINKFNLNITPDTPIFIGSNNRAHMESSHKDIYEQYSDCIEEIISAPDYVGVNPHDNSLEYYKNFGQTIIHIKIAVRPTRNGIYFAKTMYDINDSKLHNYLRRGRIKNV